MLLRRVGQLLAQGDSGIGYEQILYHVTHDHSSAYSSTLAVGLFVFEDVFDARFFENQARKMAEAIERSEEHTSELQSLMRSSYAVFCLKKKKNIRDVTD